MLNNTKDDPTSASATSLDNTNIHQSQNNAPTSSSGTPAAANIADNDANAVANGNGNGNSNLVVGPDGAIYRMVKPPIYDVDSRTAEQFANAQRVRNLGLTANMNMNPMGAAAAAHHQSLLNFNLNPGFTSYPGVNADGTVIQSNQMPPMAMINAPDLSMSSIGTFAPVTGVPTSQHNPLVLLDGNNGVMVQPVAGMQVAAIQSAEGTPSATNVAATQIITSEGSAAGNEGDGKRKANDPAPTSADGEDASTKRMRLTANLWPSVGHLAPTAAEAQQANRLGAPPNSSSSGRSYSLYVESDERNLSQYQCMARKQIEIFEATADDAGTNAQGRNRPVNLGQVGIRCRHCSKLPPKQRKTGSVYYPNRLDGVYQTAQKMTVGHLCKHCTMIPEQVREKLLFLKDQKSSDGGGKRYWADGVRSLGVVETPKDGLIFQM